MDRLSHALTRTERRGEQLAVLFLDLDRFKVVNDSLGHSVGDQLLVGVSQRLAACLRPEDTIARLGGDEFAILLEDVKDDRGPTSVADRLTAELQQPFKVEGREVIITVSIGIAMSTAKRMTPEDILRDADLAMYHAKGKGKARYEIFDKSMNAPAQERMDLELDLRNAVTRGEFTLHYQPVVDLPTGRITEVEALVRWKHPQRGLLFPADFVGLSEETGLIVPLGRWVLHEACRQTRQWQLASSGTPLAISVNISARQLQQPGLVEEIAAVLRDTRLDPSTLRLEITETVVMHDAPTTLAKLEALKALGVQLAIDDFGTGYSSLGYLKRFPVDTLKIDRSFVKGIGGNVEDSAIVRAVITVAKSLNLSVTAEGIETAEQLEHLRTLGCDHGQGYFFAKPLTSDRVPALLLSTSPWGTRSDATSFPNGHTSHNGH
jgi:diguanylate cyclase (GGDEF)-like protein